MGKPRANQKRKFSWHKHWPIFGSYEISLLFFLFHLWMYVNVKVMVWCDMMWCFVFHVFFYVFHVLRMLRISEDFFLGGRFESLCCSVCLEPCHEDGHGMRCRGATGRKSNTVIHLAMELPESCRQMADSTLGICSKGIMQLPPPKTWRNMWLQGDHWQRDKWQREEPQFLYEDPTNQINLIIFTCGFTFILLVILLLHHIIQMVSNS